MRVTLPDLLKHCRLRGVQLPAGDLGAHHEIAAVLRFLPIDAIPFHAVEIVRFNGSEAGFRIPIDVMDHIQPVFLQLEFLLGRDRDEALFYSSVVRLNFDHGGEKEP